MNFISSDLPPNYIIVHVDRIQRNIQRIRQYTQNKPIIAVVKSNGYGHDLVRLSQIMTSQGVHTLGVANLQEATQLRQAHMTTPILVFGSPLERELPHYLAHNLDITVPNLTVLQAVQTCAQTHKKRARIHLKIDTGMRRIGTPPEEAEALFIATLKAQNIECVGIYSHFATADDADLSFSYHQLELFLKTLMWFERHAEPCPLRHIANSAGTLRMPEAHLDAIRPGIALYGVMPSEHVHNHLQLEPTLSLHSTVTFSKKIPAHAGVSYGHQWHAQEPTHLATLPIGYADGVKRALSNQADVIIQGKRYRSAGNICMNQMMIETQHDAIEPQTPVTLIGEQGTEHISIEELAQQSKHIAHDILVCLNEHILRVYKP